MLVTLLRQSSTPCRKHADQIISNNRELVWPWRQIGSVTTPSSKPLYQASRTSATSSGLCGLASASRMVATPMSNPLSANSRSVSFQSRTSSIPRPPTGEDAANAAQRNARATRSRLTLRQNARGHRPVLRNEARHHHLQRQARYAAVPPASLH